MNFLVQQDLFMEISIVEFVECARTRAPLLHTNQITLKNMQTQELCQQLRCERKLAHTSNVQIELVCAS